MSWPKNGVISTLWIQDGLNNLLLEEVLTYPGAFAATIDCSSCKSYKSSKINLTSWMHFFIEMKLVKMKIATSFVRVHLLLVVQRVPLRSNKIQRSVAQVQAFNLFQQHQLMTQYQCHNVCLLHLAMLHGSATLLLLAHLVSKRKMRCRLIVMLLRTQSQKMMIYIYQIAEFLSWVLKRKSC